MSEKFSRMERMKRSSKNYHVLLKALFAASLNLQPQSYPMRRRFFTRRSPPTLLNCRLSQDIYPWRSWDAACAAAACVPPPHSANYARQADAWDCVSQLDFSMSRTHPQFYLSDRRLFRRPTRRWHLPPCGGSENLISLSGLTTLGCR